MFDKKCEKCNILKSSNNFRPNKKSCDNYFSICNECWPKPLWNKEKQAASEKKYIAKNYEKIREKWKKAGKQINRKVRDSLNHRISGALQSNNTYKNNKTSYYIGCSIPYLKEWIEYQFHENMTWENYGDWHLDHVKACCSYNLNNLEQQLLYFN